MAAEARLGDGLEGGVVQLGRTADTVTVRVLAGPTARRLQEVLRVGRVGGGVGRVGWRRREVLLRWRVVT